MSFEVFQAFACWILDSEIRRFRILLERTISYEFLSTVHQFIQRKLVSEIPNFNLVVERFQPVVSRWKFGGTHLYFHLSIVITILAK